MINKSSHGEGLPSLHHLSNTKCLFLTLDSRYLLPKNNCRGWCFVGAQANALNALLTIGFVFSMAVFSALFVLTWSVVTGLVEVNKALAIVYVGTAISLLPYCTLLIICLTRKFTYMSPSAYSKPQKHVFVGIWFSFINLLVSVIVCFTLSPWVLILHMTMIAVIIVMFGVLVLKFYLAKFPLPKGNQMR